MTAAQLNEVARLICDAWPDHEGPNRSGDADEAVDSGYGSIYLTTEAAEGLFRRLGWKVIRDVAGENGKWRVTPKLLPKAGPYFAGTYRSMTRRTKPCALPTWRTPTR